MDIVFSSTTQLAAAIRVGDISALDALEAHLAQIDQHNTTLNAVVTLDAEGARKRAREADKALANGDVWGVLHGVPFTLKDAMQLPGCVLQQAYRFWIMCRAKTVPLRRG